MKMRKEITLLIVVLFLQVDVFAQPSFSGLDKFGTGSSISSDWGDYDNDGDLDLVVGNWDGDYIYVNEGNTLFIESEPLDTNPTNFVKWIDLDGDLDLDLVIGNQGATPNYMFYNQGNGNLIRKEFLTDYDLTGLDNGDFDNDGDLDLILSCWYDDYTAIWLNDGNHNFSPDGNNFIFSEAISVLAVDVDKDLDLDIILGVGCCTDSSEVYKNDGTGLFSLYSQFGSEHTEMHSLKTIDVDNDGDIDITTDSWDPEGRICIYLNDGNGNLSAMIIDSIYYSCAEFGDIDNDDDIDLVVGSWGYLSDRVIVYENENMNFEKHTIETGGFSDYPLNAVTDISLGDADNDGDLDIAVMRMIFTSEFVTEMEQNTLLINNEILGVGNIIENSEYLIYPNPTNSVINIEMNNPQSTSICLLNQVGQVITSKHINNMQLEQLDISGFSSGIYFLKISGKDFLKVEKIIKK